MRTPFGEGGDWETLQPTKLQEIGNSRVALSLDAINPFPTTIEVESISRDELEVTWVASQRTQLAALLVLVGPDVRFVSFGASELFFEPAQLAHLGDREDRHCHTGDHDQQDEGRSVHDPDARSPGPQGPSDRTSTTGSGGG